MISYAGQVASRVARGLWGRSATGQAPVFTTHHRAWPWECDFNWHLNNANYLRNAELARWQWIAAAGLLRRFYGDGMNFVVGSQAVVHRRAIGLGRAYQVQTRLLGIEGGWLFVDQTFLVKKGATLEPVAELTLMAAVVSQGKRVDASEVFAPMVDALHATLGEAEKQALEAQSDALRVLAKSAMTRIK